MNNINSSNPILIVDDTAAHRAILKRALTKAGLQTAIIEVGSLSEAHSVLLAETATTLPALSIVDLNLGAERGSQLVSAVRLSPRLQNMPIMILSTSEMEGDIRESYEAGANCYLVKSENLETFATEVTAAVRYLLSLNPNQS